jgi:hypothetical protein
MKIGYPNTSHTELSLLATKDANRSVFGKPADAQLDRLRDMQEGVQRLQSMSGPKNLSAGKVSFLKKRLEALKALLLHATPAQAKALAREIKSIAGELKAIAKDLGTGGSGPSLSGTETAGASSAEQASAESAVADGAAESMDVESAAAETAEISGGNDVTASTGQSENLPDNAVGAEDQSIQKNTGQSSSPQDADDVSLRSALNDARKLLREVVGLLKVKLSIADKEAKEHLRAIEKSLSDLDDAMQLDVMDHLYSDQGGLVSGLDSLAVSGANISFVV